MNFSVHAVMYSYYTFRALKIKSPIPPVAITAVQLLQMAVGVVVHICCFYLYYSHGNVYTIRGMGEVQCGVSSHNMWAGVLMYCSYFVLFLKLFVQKYVFRQDGVSFGVPGTSGPRKKRSEKDL